MIKVEFEYRPVVDALRRSASVMANSRRLMVSVGGVMRNAVEDNFSEEGRPKWRDLSSSSKLSRQVNGKGWKDIKQGRGTAIGAWSGKILQRSGQLAGSIVTSADANSASVGTNKVYAAIHQFGGRTKPHVIRAKNARALSFGGIIVRQIKHPGSVIPARPFLRLTPGDLKEMMHVTRGFYNNALARNGLATIVG